jgi:hypothetical protein
VQARAKQVRAKQAPLPFYKADEEAGCFGSRHPQFHNLTI